MIGLLAMAAAATASAPVPLPVDKRNPIFITGDQLEAMCNAPDIGSCVRYVEGAADLYAVFHNSVQIGEACVPQSTNSLQAKDVVVAFIKNHPEVRRLTGAAVVVGALNEAFPCPK